jgi:hypothetical protein
MWICCEKAAVMSMMACTVHSIDLSAIYKNRHMQQFIVNILHNMFRPHSAILRCFSTKLCTQLTPTLGRTLQTVHNVHYEKTIPTTYTSSNRLVLAVMTVTQFVIRHFITYFIKS